MSMYLRNIGVLQGLKSAGMRPLLRSMQVLMPVLALSGCFAGGVQKPEAVRYDLYALDTATAEARSETKDEAKLEGERKPLHLQLMAIEAPAWLQTTAMQYRLVYERPGQRHSFVESRWVARPTELLEQMLLRQRMFQRQPASATATCQLHLQLDEFIQQFDAPEHSRALLEVQAYVLNKSLSGSSRLAQQRFQLARAAGADAQAGATAFARASAELMVDLQQWLAELQETQADSMRACESSS